ncbi:MAG: alpha-ketoglutarate-dependent dioxygenase AlkB [Corynebacterium sp.]|uniref:alpha-ketoglutarate-dependent dioxygenase AlkB n=1 Tax=Corynebacterium sp. TaxID=1720 RepID=UPI0026DFB7BF|nr:alpha-ketoglutarate-dependent dioxygenase AlkB [Corynebacterium sp.]MDO5668392.1 alpha-ketoglutarate-dependent dioxygenase AlkB [Corynebacterium sp.]
MLFDVPRPAARIRDGVAHLPGFLGLQEQAELVAQGRDIARSVAGTPVAMARPVVGSGQMSVYTLSLGRFWVANPYRYVTSVGGVDAAAIPGAWAGLAQRALEAAAAVADELAPWADGSFRAEATLVNYYTPDATMGLHVDANEISEAPVVSLSIGDEALFRIGHTEGRTRPWDDVTLMSGDLMVFGGPARRAYHGVPVVRPGTAPEGCGLREGRLNITFRQVEV